MAKGEYVTDPAVIQMLCRGVTAGIQIELEETIIMPLVKEYEEKIREVIKPIVKRVTIGRMEVMQNLREFTQDLNVVVSIKEE